jgi:hypothetical protein
VTVDLEAPPPSPNAYVDMGPVEPSHYQGLWELRQGLQQEQQQQDAEEEEPQPFLMELVSALDRCATLFLAHTLLPYIVHLLFWRPRYGFSGETERERE